MYSAIFLERRPSGHTERKTCLWSLRMVTVRSQRHLTFPEYPAYLTGFDIWRDWFTDGWVHRFTRDAGRWKANILLLSITPQSITPQSLEWNGRASPHQWPSRPRTDTGISRHRVPERALASVAIVSQNGQASVAIASQNGHWHQSPSCPRTGRHQSPSRPRTGTGISRHRVPERALASVAIVSQNGQASVAIASQNGHWHQSPSRPRTGTGISRHRVPERALASVAIVSQNGQASVTIVSQNGQASVAIVSQNGQASVAIVSQNGQASVAIASQSKLQRQVYCHSRFRHHYRFTIKPSKKDFQRVAPESAHTCFWRACCNLSEAGL